MWADHGSYFVTTYKRNRHVWNKTREKKQKEKRKEEKRPRKYKNLY